MTNEEIRELLARLRQSNQVMERKRRAVPPAPGQTPPTPKQSLAVKTARGVGNTLTTAFWFVVFAVTIIAFVTGARPIFAIGCLIIVVWYVC
jgi:hypothetical protein